MGKSITCNYHCAVSVSNDTRELIFGAMKFNEIHKQSQSIAKQVGGQLVKTVVFAQTKTGERKINKDFVILDCEGKEDHYYIDEPIPSYGF